MGIRGGYGESAILDEERPYWINHDGLGSVYRADVYTACW